MTLAKLLILFSIITNQLLQAKLALVQVPVADLISHHVAHFKQDQAPENYYQNIALSPFRPGKDINSCPRQHQALFNELVDIIEEHKHEARVRIFNAYYLDLTTKQKTGSFWTLKKNLLLFDKLTPNQTLIPKPLNYKFPQRLELDVITLLDSWHCEQTNQTYSAGTRFKINQANQTLYVYQPDQNNFKQVPIPSHLTLATQTRTPAELRKLFIDLVQNWSFGLNENFIPYTWGGCSVIQRIPVHNFELIQNNQLAYYAVPPFSSQTQTGLDCSGLVLRAAQAVGIPFFYKNTTTLAHELKPITLQDQLLPGDLIWISGHVIIIADPKTGLCIEARDYGHGYGKVQPIYLRELFKDITNFEQMKTAHLSGTPLNRIDRNGNIKGKYQIKLLKLI